MKIKFFLSVFITSAILIAAFAQDNVSKNKTATPKRKEIPITKEKLLETKIVEELIDDFPKNEYEIVSYNLTFISTDRSLLLDRNLLSDSTKENIKRMPIGSKIYIEYIKGKPRNGGTGATIKFPPVYFVIVEK